MIKFQKTLQYIVSLFVKLLSYLPIFRIKLSVTNPGIKNTEDFD